MTATSRFIILVRVLVASWASFQDSKMTIRQRQVQSQVTGKCIFATLVFVSAAFVIVVATFLLGMNVPAPDASDAYIPTQNAPTSGLCLRWNIPGIQIGTQAVCLVP